MPASPRTRSSKSMLSLDAIVAAALALVDELGCDAVSMRRVAQALDTGPASLYVYVHDRRELMALVHDQAVADVALPGEGDGDWRARLQLLVGRVVGALAAHNDIASIRLIDTLPGRHALRITEEMLRLLRLGGIDDASCAWAADLLGQYVASSALEKAASSPARQAPEDSADTGTDRGAGALEAFPAQLNAVFRSLPAEHYPTLRALAPQLTGGDSDTRANWKLRVIIDGLLAQGRSGTAGSPSTSVRAHPTSL
jgi:AcrR family transcriptional regulator